MRPSIATFAVVSVMTAVASVAIGAPPVQRSEIARAVAAKTRTPAKVERDKYRHPTETLAYFGVKPSDTVVEIWPGGGWYTEILAPYLNARGVYYATALSASGAEPIKAMQAANPAIYGKIRFATFPAFDAAADRVPDGSADVVLTFRNVHNWQMGSGRENKDYAADAFRQMYAMLRPGGTLGIVEHRLPETRDAAAEMSSGYMKVSSIRKLAENAGFRFAGASEINANPKDTADWPKGVWTLPPNYALKDVDRAKYAAIGESDRMTLKFIKPGK